MEKHGKYRALVKRLGLACATALVVAGGAAAECRQALALGIDVSGSVDAREYWLQREGLANALTAPEVEAAFLAAPSTPVHLLVFEWSGVDYQKLLTPWTEIASAEDLSDIAEILRESPRPRGPNATGIGAAALFAGEMFAAGPLCWRKTLDLSGDGKNNDGPEPRMIWDDPRLADVTINALVIATDHQGPIASQNTVAELVAYFQVNVIKGADAFTEVALGFEDFERAMRRKLLRELEAPPVSLETTPAPLQQTTARIR